MKSLVLLLVAGTLGMLASGPNGAAAPTQMVITVRPSPGDDRPNVMEPGDLTVLRGNTAEPVVRLQRLTGDLADMQLFILLDDSTRSSSLATHLPELKAFIGSLPASTQIAVG